jgi:hypothetical protein
MTATAAAPESLSSAVVLTGPIGTTKNLRSMIGERWKMVHALLPAHMTEDRFAALVISAASENAEGVGLLRRVDPERDLSGGIDRVGDQRATGEAYLLPYKGKAQLVPGYKGLVKLAIQSREVRAIEARLVYDGEKDFERVLRHRLAHRARARTSTSTRTPDGAFAYAVAKLPSWRDDVRSHDAEAARRHLAAVARARTTARGRRTAKRCTARPSRAGSASTLPMSPQLAQALELSDEAEEIDARRARSVGSDALNQALKSSPEESEEAEDATPVPVGKKSCPTCLRNDGTHDPDKSCYTDG